MNHVLGFKTQMTFDPGQDSITIPVVVMLGRLRVPAMAKVDTEASDCVFAREVGERLGLEIESGRKLTMRTVTGSFTAYGHEIGLAMTGIETDTTVYFAEHNGFPVNILGRRGWIDRLRLGLIDYDGMLYLSHYDDET